MTVTTERTSQPIRAQLFIGGAWIEGEEQSNVVSPATGEELGSVPQGSLASVDLAVAAARQAQESWGALSVFARADALRRLASVVDQRREQIALTLALEQGKPLKAEAEPEVDLLIGYLELAAQHATALEGTMPPSAEANKRILVYRTPRGVIGAIQPWNFPLETIGIQVVPALATGNAVVSVPAPTTSLTPFLFAQCCEEAELPAGVFNLVSGSGAVVGDAVAGHPEVDAVIFTGSPATGELVARRAAGKPQVLELGGNGPFVVLDDADLDLAIPAALTSCFYCAGQTCTAGEQLLIQDGVYDEFAGRLAEAVSREVHLGHPLDESSTIGPLNNEQVAAKMDRHVADAVANGAEVLLGGVRRTDAPTRLYWEPTVLAGVTAEAELTREETFGPVAPMRRISSDEEALQVIKASRYGLASAVFSRDLARALRFAERARTGTVVINDASVYLEQHIPFGGAAGKSSGIGRAHGRTLMESLLTDLKTVVVHLDQ